MSVFGQNLVKLVSSSPKFVQLGQCQWPEPGTGVNSFLTAQAPLEQLNVCSHYVLETSTFTTGSSHTCLPQRSHPEVKVYHDHFEKAYTYTNPT